MVSIASARAGRVRGRTAQPSELDPFIVILVAVLSLFGLVAIWSADGGGAIAAGSSVMRQAVYFIAGLGAMAVLSSVHYRFLKSFAVVMYLGSIGLLLSLLAIGTNIDGSTRWITFGPLSFQPSEVAKVAVIVTLAAFISERQYEMDRFSNFLLTMVIAGVPAGIVFIQPDLGTTGVFAAIWLGMLLMSSTRMIYIVGTMLLSIPGALIAWQFLMRDYQKDRLLVSYDPYRDYFGGGFNIIQAQISIGSAGWFGHGLTGGLQSQYEFLSVRNSDFIFAHAMSMFGFIGGIALFATFLLLIWRLFRAVTIARDTFGQQIAAGVATMIFFQTFINIGMNLGLMPVTGIPLPFVSLGGTALFINLGAIGIIESIVMHHRKLGFQSV